MQGIQQASLGAQKERGGMHKKREKTENIR